MCCKFLITVFLLDGLTMVGVAGPLTNNHDPVPVVGALAEVVTVVVNGTPV